MFTFDIQKNGHNIFCKIAENGLKLEYARKSVFFDQKTSYIYDTHFGPIFMKKA